MEMRDCPVRLQPGIEGGQDVTLDTALLSHAGTAELILTMYLSIISNNVNGETLDNLIEAFEAVNQL